MKESLNEKTSLFSLCLRSVATLVAMCACAVFLMAQSSGITAKDAKAKEVLDAAHKAIGGADKIGDIKSLIVKGKGTNAIFSSMNQGPMRKTGSLPYDFEIRILFPDNFLQIDRFPERTAYSGISQGKPLASAPTPIIISGVTIPLPPVPQDEDAKAKAETTAVNRQMNTWSRFLIGMLLKAGPAPLTLSSGSMSDRFSFTIRDGATEEIEFDSKTGYPSVVRYETIGLPQSTKPTTMSIKDPVTGETKTATFRTNSYPTNGTNTVVSEILFRDRFSVNGIMFPLIINTIAPTSDVELRIEDVQINPNLSLKDFEIPK